MSALFACTAPTIGESSIDENEEDDGAGVTTRRDASTTLPPSDAGTTDLGLDAGDGGGEGGTTDASRNLRVFASSSLHNGNLGGVAGADTKCQALADAKGMGGTFRAWISASGANAIDRITSAGPWYLGTEMVVASRAGLASGALLRAIRSDENGTTLPTSEDRIWTGTASNGSHSTPDCNGWTSTSGSGRVGEGERSDTGWTSLTTEACNQVNRIYCFEL